MLPVPLRRLKVLYDKLRYVLSQLWKRHPSPCCPATDLLRGVQIFGRHSGLFQGYPHFLVDKSHSQSVSICRHFSQNVAGWVSKVFNFATLSSLVSISDSWSPRSPESRFWWVTAHKRLFFLYPQLPLIWQLVICSTIWQLLYTHNIYLYIFMYRQGSAQMDTWLTAMFQCDGNIEKLCSQLHP